MMTITRFTLDPKLATLAIDFTDTKGRQKQQYSLSFEFIRVFTPDKSNLVKNTNVSNQAVIDHKKLINLLEIEPVAKHGYRFVFDDQHQAIYSEDYLFEICQQQQTLWQQYLSSLKANKQSREATIDITQL